MKTQQHYDKYKRNQESRSFYKSAAWDKCRKIVLDRDNHLCQDCLNNKKVTPADMVHHIEELTDRPDLALDPSNLVSLCNPCHNKQHPDRGKKENNVSNKIKIVKNKKNPESG